MTCAAKNDTAPAAEEFVLPSIEDFDPAAWSKRQHSRARQRSLLPISALSSNEHALAERIGSCD